MADTFNWTRCYEGNLTMVPNGDVSGPGMIGSFVGTGWLVTILVIGYYLIGFDPNTQFRDIDDPGEPMANLDSRMLDDGPGTGSLCPNPIDEILLALFHRFFVDPARRLAPNISLSNYFGSRRSVLRSLEKCILAMCDAQIVTGLGLLTSGYVSLIQGTLTAYHWRIIIYLAWFSNLTHQAALLFLRGYLRKHPRERLWRFCLMTILVVMMVVALFPTVFFNWDEPQCDESSQWSHETCRACSSAAYPAAPARCFYDHATFTALRGISPMCLLAAEESQLPSSSTSQGVNFADSTALQSAIISALVLIVSYTLRAVRLFETLSAILQHRVRPFLARTCRAGVATILGWQLPCRLLGGPLWSLMVLRPVLALYISGRLVIDFMLSTFSDVCWLVVSATIGTLRLFDSTGMDHEGEASWTFGQMMSVILLLGPLLTLVMSLTDRGSDDAKHRLSEQYIQNLYLTTATRGDPYHELETQDIHSTNSAPNSPRAQQNHFYTTDHLSYGDEINRLFMRDYYNEFVWIVTAVLTLSIIPIQVLVLLVIGLILHLPLASVLSSFVIPVASYPGKLHLMVSLGLVLEGWKFEFFFTLISLIAVFVITLLPIIVQTLNSHQKDPLSDTAVTIIAMATSYGPMLLYMMLCPPLYAAKGLWESSNRTGVQRREDDTELRSGLVHSGNELVASSMIPGRHSDAEI